MRKARAAAALRHQGLDAKRRKLKEELEAREAKAFSQQPATNTTSATDDSDELAATKRLQKEVRTVIFFASSKRGHFCADRTATQRRLETVTT